MGALEAEKHSPERLDTSKSHSLHDRSSSEPDAFNKEFVKGEGRQAVQSGLGVTEDDLLEAKDLASTFSLDEVREVRRSKTYPPSPLSLTHDAAHAQRAQTAQA